MKKTFLILSLLILVGCSTVSNKYTVGNDPVRTIRIAAITDCKMSYDEIYELTSQVSAITQEQVGIKLVITRFISMGIWESYWDVTKVVQQSYERMSHEKQYYWGDCCLYGYHQWGSRYEDWDIAVVFGKWRVEDTMADVIQKLVILFPTKLSIRGVIDDTWRRYIVLRSSDVHTFLHEFYHCFIFSRIHGDGIMRSFIVEPIPGSRVAIQSYNLSERDRMEVLENKWRVFSKRIRR